jgi:hypothetical protein
MMLPLISTKKSHKKKNPKAQGNIKSRHHIKININIDWSLMNCQAEFIVLRHFQRGFFKDKSIKNYMFVEKSSRKATWKMSPNFQSLKQWNLKGPIAFSKNCIYFHRFIVIKFKFKHTQKKFVINEFTLIKSIGGKKRIHLFKYFFPLKILFEFIYYSLCFSIRKHQNINPSHQKKENKFFAYV